MKTSDKVVLIRAIDYTTPLIFTFGPCLKVGTVYCIERVLPRLPHWRTDGLSLVGHTTYCAMTGFEIGYDARCFRPLEEVQFANRILRETET
jgi:hypothetical protein